jgi:hypothetical protein
VNQHRFAKLMRERDAVIERYLDGNLNKAQFEAELARMERRKGWAVEVAAMKAKFKRDRRWRGVAAGVEVFGGGRTRRHPPAIAIVRAQRHIWSRHLRTLNEALVRCWGCKRQPVGDLEKAHIHPVRFGGADDPKNMLLLCWWCHVEQNDEDSRWRQLRWLRNHKSFDEHWQEQLLVERGAP